MRKVNPATAAPVPPTSCAAAFAVPPVASTSSTISTRFPGSTASWCISRASEPYSSAYSTRCVAAGSFPGFRMGTSPAPSASAIGAPNKKPGDIIDPRVRRAALQMSLQHLKCRLRALRNYFNRAIWKVLYVPAELQSLRLTHDKPPEPDALNAPSDNPAAEAHFGCRRRTI